MDLANMRSLGVTHVMAYCKCGHEASIDVSALPAGVHVPEIKNRLRCIKCGADQWKPGQTGGSIT
jgi:hypothetical protein